MLIVPGSIVQSLLWLFIYMFNLFKSSVIYNIIHVQSTCNIYLDFISTANVQTTTENVSTS